MKTMKTALVAAGVAGLLMGATNVFADGEALYTSKLCVTCHGAGGDVPIQPTYPKLGGQNAPYCVQQVKDIKGGVRTNGMTAAMKPLVQALTDEEIDAICGYLAGL
jgi:cytochrome c553